MKHTQSLPAYQNTRFMDQKLGTLMSTEIAGEWMFIHSNALKDLKGIDSSAYSEFQNLSILEYIEEQMGIA